ncbi:MAG: carbohydrate-binding family 9-like protein [Clostridia bacterium]|nr:carbohydrate-binding family 9-like protein [Clostridia bacterium]
MTTYNAPKIVDADDPFENSPPAAISHYHPDGTPGVAPRCEFWAAWDDTALRFRMRAYELPRAWRTEHNSGVWQDSCMECFINLTPRRDDNYFNIEINALGTALTGFGDDSTSALQTFAPGIFGIKPLLFLDALPTTEAYWQIEFCLPFAALAKFFGPVKPEKGMVFKANLYKIGDETAAPHYGSWSEVDPTVRAQFHQYRSFGEIVLG